MSATFIGPSRNGIVLGQKSRETLETGLSRVSFSPENNDSYLHLNGRPYHGAIEIIAVTRGTKEEPSPLLMVLNIVHVEDYLKGVVPAEIGRLPEEEIEAVKAQAVAARTYAFSRLGQYEKWGYDLESTVEDQVYYGAEREDPVADAAIKSTMGLVLMKNGKPIDAYYHANCGGRTEYIERVWDKPPEPYLVPVKDDYCQWAKSYRWEETWHRADLEANLASYLDTLAAFPEAGLGELVDLAVKERSPSERVETLEVVTEFATYEIEKDKVRWALRRSTDPSLILRSTLFDLEIERDADNSIEQVTARGLGTGHGVGMCQTGAIGMARQGFSFDEILMHYYTGVELRMWEDK